MLVPLRFIQALGGGAFMPSAAGIIGDRFGRDRDRGIGMISSIVPIGQVVGPVLGGVITQFWIWRGIFFVNVPIGLVLYALAWRHIPRTEPRDAGHLDFAGVALLASTIIAGMLTITFMGEPGGLSVGPESPLMRCGNRPGLSSVPSPHSSSVRALHPAAIYLR